MLDSRGVLFVFVCLVGLKQWGWVPEKTKQQHAGNDFWSFEMVFSAA